MQHCAYEGRLLMCNLPTFRGAMMPMSLTVTWPCARVLTMGASCRLQKKASAGSSEADKLRAVSDLQRGKLMNSGTWTK